MQNNRFIKKFNASLVVLFVLSLLAGSNHSGKGKLAKLGSNLSLDGVALADDNDDEDDDDEGDDKDDDDEEDDDDDDRKSTSSSVVSDKKASAKTTVTPVVQNAGSVNYVSPNLTQSYSQPQTEKLPDQIVTETVMENVILLDSDRDGIPDVDDQNPTIAEIFIVSDINNNGIDDNLEVPVLDVDGNGIVDAYEKTNI